MPYKTISDVFNPLQSGLQLEQIRESRQRQKANEIKQAMIAQEAAKAKQFAQYQKGQLAQPEQQPIVDNNAMDAIGASLDDNIQKRNFGNINKLGQMMAKKFPEAKVKIWSDEKAKEAHTEMTDNFTREQLDEMSKAPGAGFMKGLPPGKYTLDYDPINQVFRPMAIPVEENISKTVLTDTKSLSDNQLFRGVALGDPLAQKILNEKLKHQEKLSFTRSGQMTDQGIELGATQYLLTGKMPALGRGGANRAKIANRAAQLAKENNLTSPKLYGKRTGLTTAQKSYNKQRVNLDSDIKTANEFYIDIARFKPQIEKLRTNYPALVNKSVVQLKKIAATPSLGEEAVLAQELDAILSAYIRVAREASGSISEMSVGAQEAAKKLLNFNSPAFVLIQQLDNFEKAMKDKIQSREKSLEKQFNSIEKFATIKKNKKESKKPKFVIEAVE